MTQANQIRALTIAMRCMGPQEGITQQISNVRLGRTCKASSAAFPAQEAHFEATLIFDRQDEIDTTAWKIRIQDEHERALACMVDLYDNHYDPFDPL